MSVGGRTAPEVRGPGGRLVAILAVLLGLLAIVALASRGHAAPVGRGGSTRAPSQVLVDLVFTLILCGMACTILFLAYLVTWKKAEAKKKGSLRGTLVSIAYIAAVLGLFLLLSIQAHNHHRRALTIPRFGQQRAKLERQAAGRQRAHTPAFEWQLAAGLAALGVAAVVVPLVRRRLRVRQAYREQRIAEALAGVLDESLDDLLRERDPRRAVIAAYARMERTLEAEGLPRRHAEAPFEYLSRVFAELRTSGRTAFALTELFERAKFSTHRVDGSMKDEAISALVALRNDLRAVAV